MISDYEFILQMDLNPYKNQWIAVCNSKVVSFGKDFKTVFNEAKKKCKSRPTITKITESRTFIL